MTTLKGRSASDKCICSANRAIPYPVHPLICDLMSTDVVGLVEAT